MQHPRIFLLLICLAGAAGQSYPQNHRCSKGNRGYAKTKEICEARCKDEANCLGISYNGKGGCVTCRNLDAWVYEQDMMTTSKGDFGGKDSKDSKDSKDEPDDICSGYAFQGPKDGVTPPEATTEGCQVRCAKEKRCVAMAFHATESRCRQCEHLVSGGKDKEGWKTTPKSEFEVSYTFPPTDTNEFVHGLCVMGAKEFTAYDNSNSLGYKLLDQAFGNGVKLWADRSYVTSGVSGPAMCEGGMYLQPSHHKVSQHELIHSISFVLSRLLISTPFLFHLRLYPTHRQSRKEPILK
jgi:hypothetical protein